MSFDGKKIIESPAPASAGEGEPKDVTIRVQDLGKCYQIYQNPRDRLKQLIYPSFRNWLGQQEKRYYKEFWALRDVSFEIKRGETVGVIGKNGSGKSTLLQMLAGTLTPTTGTVQLSGRLAALLELGAGFNPEFTGRENVFLNGTILGLTTKEVTEKIDDILAFADIGEFIDQPVKTYSSGMFVRLAFAIQANVDPDILLVDEALAVGDAYFVHRCNLRFNQLRDRGTTILLVTHNVTAVKMLCSRVIWLDKGLNVHTGEPTDVVDRYTAALKHLPVLVDKSKKPDADGATSLPENAATTGGDEDVIPNIDRRHGNQSFSILGLGLYNDKMVKSSIIQNNESAIFRITFINNSLEAGRLMVVGCCFRNCKGVDIASNNSEIEKADIASPPPGETVTVRMKTFFPELHPGSYSINISVGYRKENGEMESADGIVNAMVFELTSTRTVHVLMSLPTEFSVER